MNAQSAASSSSATSGGTSNTTPSGSNALDVQSDEWDHIGNYHAEIKGINFNAYKNAAEKLGNLANKQKSNKQVAIRDADGNLVGFLAAGIADKFATFMNKPATKVTGKVDAKVNKRGYWDMTIDVYVTGGRKVSTELGKLLKKELPKFALLDNEDSDNSNGSKGR